MGSRGAEEDRSRALTETGQIIGTLGYVSSEQISGTGAVDQRSDVFSLGTVLFRLLTGRIPYDLANAPLPEVVRILHHEEPPRLIAISSRWRGDVATIVKKAMDRNPSRRYAKAG